MQSLKSSLGPLLPLVVVFGVCGAAAGCGADDDDNANPSSGGAGSLAGGGGADSASGSGSLGEAGSFAGHGSGNGGSAQAGGSPDAYPSRRCWLARTLLRAAILVSVPLWPQACNPAPRSDVSVSNPRAGPSALPARSTSRSSSDAAPDASAPAPAGHASMEKGTLATRVGRSAVQDVGEAKQWPKLCYIARPCPALAALRPCPSNIQAIEASSIAGGAAPGIIGNELAVRGRLGLFGGTRTAKYCGKWKCCNKMGTLAFLGDPPHGLYLAPHGCFGDESRRCCTVPAFGQEVVAVGKLSQLGEGDQGVFWGLRDTSLCIEKKGAASAASP